MNTATKSFEPLGELYVETICQNAYYEGAAGSIRDAVWASLQGDTKGNIDCGLVDAAQKLTHDAMGFMERTMSWISMVDGAGHADWKRIDEFFVTIPTGDTERQWVIQQLTEQSERAWDAYGDHCEEAWAHDLTMAATFFKAAAMLLKEVQS